MFEPVTITRSASVTGGAGAAPAGGGARTAEAGGRSCAYAFDAIMRGIPTQATRVIRRNPNIESPVLIIVSPLVKLGLRHRIKKNFAEWQEFCNNSETFFCVAILPCAGR